MKAALLWLAILALAAGNAAFAVDKSTVPPSNDVSPLEQHPECMDRTAAANSSNCTIQDNGTPRHHYPPKAVTKSPVPKPVPKAKPAPQAAKLHNDAAK